MHKPTLTGSCYCGNLQLAIGLSQSPADYQPRACDCEFCCKHGAAWLSDPDGVLTITVRDDARLRRLKQGDELAEFLLCADCGVVVAVSYEAAGTRFAAINARAVTLPADRAQAFAEPVPASPKRLSAAEKTARWQQLWFRGVILQSRPSG
ncbi:MAG: aldehyde-activating protein [Pseudomonadota bacterium]